MENGRTPVFINIPDDEERGEELALVQVPNGEPEIPKFKPIEIPEIWYRTPVDQIPPGILCLMQSREMNRIFAEMEANVLQIQGGENNQENPNMPPPENPHIRSRSSNGSVAHLRESKRPREGGKP